MDAGPSSKQYLAQKNRRPSAIGPSSMHFWHRKQKTVGYCLTAVLQVAWLTRTWTQIPLSQAGCMLGVYFCLSSASMLHLHLSGSSVHLRMVPMHSSSRKPPGICLSELCQIQDGALASRTRVSAKGTSKATSAWSPRDGCSPTERQFGSFDMWT